MSMLYVWKDYIIQDLFPLTVLYVAIYQDSFLLNVFVGIEFIHVLIVMTVKYNILKDFYDYVNLMSFSVMIFNNKSQNLNDSEPVIIQFVICFS